MGNNSSTVGNCPFCNKAMPSGVYDSTTHTTDLTGMTNHLANCGAMALDLGGAAVD